MWSIMPFVCQASKCTFDYMFYNECIIMFGSATSPCTFNRVIIHVHVHICEYNVHVHVHFPYMKITNIDDSSDVFKVL